MADAGRVISLLTDFGVRDTYVGQMKGVIAGIAPAAVVVDLTHEVPRQDVAAGAVILDDAVDAFAAGTIHVAVVDPGVGGVRRAVAVQTQRFTLVGPDNGVFGAVLMRYPLRRAVELTNRRYQHEPVSATFHGRDVFAPAAAHLAVGVAIGELGEAVEELTTVEVPKARVQGNALVGQVLWVDHFGNLVTNVKRDEVQQWTGDGRTVRVTVADRGVGEIRRTFSDAPRGEAVAYFGSSGRLEVAVRNGSAAAVLGTGRGTGVRVSRSR